MTARPKKRARRKRKASKKRKATARKAQGKDADQLVEDLGRCELQRARLTDFVPADYNPRKISGPRRARLRKLVERFGLVQPVVVNRRTPAKGWPKDATPTIVGGRQRTDLLIAAGVEWTDVRYVDLDATDEKVLLLGLNNTHAMGTWTEGLGEVLDEIRGDAAGVELADQVGLRELAADFEKAFPKAADEQPAVEPPVPDLPKRPTTKHGAVYALGRHRLVCGDCFKVERPKRIHAVVTDPPYAIFGSSSGVSTNVADDAMIRPFCENVMHEVLAALPKFGHAYVYCDWRSWPVWSDAARVAGIEVANMIVWDKGDFGLGNKYRNNHELVAFLQHVPERTSHMKKAEAGRRLVHEPNVIRMNRTGQTDFEKEHEPGQRFKNAAKPVDMLAHFIRQSTDKNDRVWDPFGGSGSTLLACEITDRVCHMVEKDRASCDVIVQRWEQLTNKTARLLKDPARSRS